MHRFRDKSPHTRTAFGIIALLSVLVLGLSGCGRVDTDSAIESVLAWTRMAPFPDSAQDLTVTTEGGPFSRAFRVTFRAPADDVAQWIAGSPGTQGLAPEQVGPDTLRYVIAPGGGAQYAEVEVTRVDPHTSLVRIYTYWS